MRPTGWQMDVPAVPFQETYFLEDALKFRKSPPYAFGLRRRFSVTAKKSMKC